MYISNNVLIYSISDNVIIVSCQYSVNIMLIVDQTNITITLYKMTPYIIYQLSNHH